MEYYAGKRHHLWEWGWKSVGEWAWLAGYSNFGKIPPSHLVSPPLYPRACGRMPQGRRSSPWGSRSKVLQLIRDRTKLASLPPCLATDCDPGAVWSPAQHPHCPAALNSSLGLDLWAMALSVSPLGQADTAVTKTDKVPADIYHSVSKVEISKQGHYRVG